MRNVRVGGIWLASIGAFTDVATSHIWPRGCEQLTFRMAPKTTHPVLDRGGALAEGFDGGVRTWMGRLAEPGGNGEYVANGTWSEAAGVLALNSAGDATDSTLDAISTAIDSGALPNWVLPAGTPDVVWGAPTDPMPLLEFLDKAYNGVGQRWWVDADGVFRVGTDPTMPTYHVPHAAAGKGLTLAEDTYFSHLVGQYVATGPVLTTVTVGDADAAAWFGYKQARTDLSGMGVITEPTAIAQLQARLDLVGARMGFAENLDLGYGEITTPGGVPVSLTMPVACTRAGGVMVRLLGVRDRTRAGGLHSTTDVVVARSVYADGAATLQLTPAGKAPRDLQELLAGGNPLEVA